MARAMPKAAEPEYLRMHRGPLARVSRRAAAALPPKLRARGVFWDGPGGGAFELWMVCECFALYRWIQRMARQVSGRARRALLREAERERVHCRELGAKFFNLLEPARVALAAIDAAGEDVELRAWFTPGGPLPRPRRAAPRRHRGSLTRREHA